VVTSAGAFLVKGETIVRSYMVVATVAVALVSFPLVEGCCCVPGLSEQLQELQDIASAATKVFGTLQDIQDNPPTTPEEAIETFETVAETIQGLEPSEIAAVISLVPGVDWSEDDAQAAKDLAAEFDEEAIENLTQNPPILDDPETFEEDIVAALRAAGINITNRQVDLIVELIEAVEDLGSLAGLIPGLPPL